MADYRWQAQCCRVDMGLLQRRNPQWQGGWEAYEGDGVSTVFCRANGREDAISYAQQRAGYAPTEIEVLDNDWNVVETISPETVHGLV